MITAVTNDLTDLVLQYIKIYNDAELFRLSDKETTQDIENRTYRFFISVTPVILLQLLWQDMLPVLRLVHGS